MDEKLEDEGSEAAPAESKSARYDTMILRKKYEENPFLVDGRFQVPTRNKGERLETVGPLAVVDSATGEATSVAEIRRVKHVDSERFVKLFVGQLNAFFDLRPGSVKLMTAIIDELSQSRYVNGDQIYLNYNQVRSYFVKHGSAPPAKTTFLLSLAELVEKGFVAPSINPNLFFINPAIFFNGDRVRFVTEFRRKKNKREELESRGQGRLQLGLEEEED